MLHLLIDTFIPLLLAKYSSSISLRHSDSMCLRRFCQDLDSTGLVDYKKSIMALSDGGKLYRTEMEIVLCRDSTL